MDRGAAPIAFSESTSYRGVLLEVLGLEHEASHIYIGFSYCSCMLRRHRVIVFIKFNRVVPQIGKQTKDPND